MNSQAIQAVKSRLTLSDVVRRYVDLRPVSGRFMGPCPFHKETKPSFSVNDEEGFFYCFGCQAAGDVISFYQRINGLEFRDALEQLAAEAGVELKPERDDPQAREQQQRKKTFLDMHEHAREFFRRSLKAPAGEIARAYLGKRGLTPATVEAFGLGFSPDDWHGLDAFLAGKGYRPEQGVEAGLLSRNEKGNIYDRFRARLIFPIQNLSGRVIAFGGRILTDGEPKYLNSSDSPIYKKGEHLYGLHQARATMARTRRALLTEGYMDVLSLHQFGYTDSCGVLGTALTSDQVKRLAGFCSRVDLVFDGDSAGRKAALKSSEMILLQGVACRVVLMPEGEDVDSLLQTRGTQGLDACLEKAEDGFSFCMRTMREQFAPREMLAWAKGFFDKLADDGLRAFYLPRLVQGLGLSEAEMRRALGAGGARPGKADAVGRMVLLPPPGKDEKEDRYLLRFAVQYPDYVPHLEELGLSDILVTERAKLLWEKLVRHHGQDIMPWLDEAQKRFFARCRQELPDQALSGHTLREEWQHICGMVEQTRHRVRREKLKLDLKNAQESGDLEKIQECLQALNDGLGSGDEHN